MSIIKVVYFITRAKKKPFSEWLEDLDLQDQTIVLTRIARLKMSNFGDCKMIKGSDGVWELRLDHGPGYRIYFGRERATIVVLLIGGSKNTQTRDIAKAQRYWLEYKELPNE